MIINGTNYKLRQGNTCDLNLGYKIKEIAGGRFAIGDWVSGDRRTTESSFIGTRTEMGSLQAYLDSNTEITLTNTTLDSQEYLLGSEVSNSSFAGQSLKIIDVGNIDEIDKFDKCVLSTSFEFRGTPPLIGVTPSVDFYPDNDSNQIIRTRNVSRTQSGPTDVVIKDNDYGTTPLDFTLTESEAKQMKFFYANNNRLDEFTIPGKWVDIKVFGNRTSISTKAVILFMSETIVSPDTHLISMEIRESF